MVYHVSDIEQWIDASSDSVWERNPDNKVFSLARFRESQVDERWGAGDIAMAINCGLSDLPDDGAPVAGSVAFPPEFKYSPNTGKPLVKCVPKVCTWLPASGAEGLKSGLLRGGCLTNHPLQLKGDASPTRDPDLELPLPGYGRYRFCCGAFGLSSSFLLALEAKQGVIFCWIPSLQEWSELKPTGKTPYLGTESFSPRTWSIEAQDMTRDTILFWPSDCGLIALKVNVLSLSYEARLLVEGRCLAVPQLLKNKLYVLIEDPDGSTRVMSVDPGWNSVTQPSELALNDIPSAKWNVAAVTPREVIWLSNLGQVILRPDAQQYLFIPWESGSEPQFMLGGPHCSSDGRLWMQVFHPTLHDGEGGFCFVQLGRPNPEKRLSFGARALTGRSCIKVEQRCKEDPWVEPNVVSTSVHHNNEAVIPILESRSDGTMLVLRVDHLQGILQFFERTGENLPTRFQIMGQHGDEGFYMKRLQEPWATEAFIFDETLFLYHPNMETIPGWHTYSDNLTATIEIRR